MMSIVGYDESLTHSLLNPDCYDHDVDQISIVQTHISSVLLTGRYAYKIKKPINLGFLDYSTLAKRFRYCHEEIRLNKRMAPDLYIGVVPITGGLENPIVNGDGEVIEYAVKMHQFPQENQLDRLMARGGVDKGMIDEVALLIADFHENVSHVTYGSYFGSPRSIKSPADDNFKMIRKLITDKDDLKRIGQLELWSQNEYKRIKDKFVLRKEKGFIRECHGDLHLANMAIFNGRVELFDCIEFNENFHWIDVINDAAFLVMDLYDHGRGDLANRFLNNYLEARGDYSALAVLRYYLSYRAMVRAKVAALKMREPGQEQGMKMVLAARYRSYLDQAENYSVTTKPELIITTGESGSGKTSYTSLYLEQTGAIRIRSDVERKRLFGLEATENSGCKVGEGIYSQDANRQTYDLLLSRAQTILEAGYTCIVDASFLSRFERARFMEMAKRVDVPFLILKFKVNREQLKRRVNERKIRGGDPSEATVEVLEKQLSVKEALTEEEMNHALSIEAN